MSTRERGTGRYSYDGRWDRLCVCGHPLGEHAAERVSGQQPCFHGDAEPSEPCDCERFTPRKQGKKR